MKTVLAVEDDKILVGLLGKALVEYGYTLAYSPQVTGSFERTKEMHPHLIFLDVMLPDGAGFQLARRIRMDRDVYATPVLFMSSMSDPPEVEYALQQGGDLYLAKPFSLKQMLEKIEQLEVIAGNIERHSESTGLPGLAALERELDCRLFNSEPFGLCLLTIENYREYYLAKGKDLAEETLRIAADALKAGAKDLCMDDVFLAHPGGFHFFAVVALEHIAAFYKEVEYRLEQKWPELYKDHELKDGYIVVSKQKGTYSGYPLMRFGMESLCSKEGEHLTGHSMVYHLGRVHKHGAHVAGENRLFRWEQDKKW